jgi:hypothetical protein
MRTVRPGLRFQVASGARRASAEKISSTVPKRIPLWMISDIEINAVDIARIVGGG